jgi:beta-mannosidase
LVAAEVIGDPALGFNELNQQWVGRTDWEYRCRFNADEALFAHDRIDLVFDGLDTIAAISLNDTAIGAAANLFHPHRFDALAALRRGDNELVIRFTSPPPAGEWGLGPVPAYPQGRVQLRLGLGTEGRHLRHLERGPAGRVERGEDCERGSPHLSRHIT